LKLNLQGARGVGVQFSKWNVLSLLSLSLNRITSQTPPCFSPLPRPTYFSLYALSLLFILFLLKPTIARCLHAELLWPSHKSQWQGGRGQGLLWPQRGLAAARVKLP
jgi:hypothetical protein